MDADGAGDAAAAGATPEGMIPGYEFRLETAKLLLDLDDTTDAAVRVLEGLIEERDVVPDAWFLLALAHHGACKFRRARDSLDHAQEARNLSLPPSLSLPLSSYLWLPSLARPRPPSPFARPSALSALGSTEVNLVA